MSALAKKMMEKYGWKEGEGLGKERTGMKSYVKVVRRDPNVATGLGHAADPAQGGSLASTHAVELDAIYGQLHTNTKRRKRTNKKEASGSGESSSGSSDSEDEGRESDSSSEVEAVTTATQKPQSPRRQRASASDNSSSSSSDSDSDSDGGDDEQPEKRFKGEASGDVTRMTDADLFQRCGGVRLGRAGRHRYFDGKLKRIHDTN